MQTQEKNKLLPSLVANRLEAFGPRLWIDRLSRSESLHSSYAPGFITREFPTATLGEGVSDNMLI